MRARVALAIAAAAAVAAGCGDDGARNASVPPGCERAAPASGQKLPRELPRPAVEPIAHARSADGQAIVQGFVARLPGQAIADIERRPGMRVLAREDEGADAELTVTDGHSRTAYKLVKACARGSRFTAVIVPEPR